MKKHLTLILLISIIFGVIVGSLLGSKAEYLKPVGDIYLNLLFTILVPLIFFALSSSIARSSDTVKIGRIFIWSIVIFAASYLLSAIYMYIVVKMFPVTVTISNSVFNAPVVEPVSISERIVKTLTTGDFVELFSRKNMLPVIIASIMFGVAVSALKEKAKPVLDFINAANAVMIKLVEMIMYCAPIGMFAFFAYFAGVLGTQLMNTYTNICILYYSSAVLYLVVFSLIIFLIFKYSGLKNFWNNITTPAIMAFGTCSSMVTIPCSLTALQNMNVDEETADIVLPLGITLHKVGSCLYDVMKIMVLFMVFNHPIDSIGTVLMIIAVGILSAFITGGIPNGGFISDLLAINLFNFPMEVFPFINLITILTDPAATMLNTTGNIFVTRIIGKKIDGR